MTERGDGRTRPGRKARRAWMLGAAVALAVAGGLTVASLVLAGLVQRVHVTSDGSVIRDPAVASSLRSVLWSAPRPIPDGDGREGGPPFGQDAPSVQPGLAPPRPLMASTGTLLLARRVAGRGHDIFFRELTPRGWSAQAPIDGAETDRGGETEGGPETGGEGDAGGPRINSPHEEIDPCLSADGRILVFASDRPGGHGGFDLYWSRRSGSAWDEPRNLGGRTNSPYDDTGPTLDVTGALLVFATRRPTSFLLAPPADWSGILIDDWKPGSGDLAFARRSPSGLWGEPRLLAECSTRSEEKDPWLDPSGDFLYFASDRPGSVGGFDLYRARVAIAPGGGAEADAREGHGRDARGDAAGGGDAAPGDARARDADGMGPALRAWAPESLGKPINSAYDETSPRIFLGGFALAYVASDPASRSSILLESRTREVESSLEIASIPLRALAAGIVRLAWLAFLGALLVAAVSIAVRYRRVWEVSLIARCAAIAILLHALLVYGFYFWVVGDDIVAMARREEPLPEVTVERMLQARISLETNALRSEAPRAPPSFASERSSAERTFRAEEPTPAEMAPETAVALLRSAPRPGPDLPPIAAPALPAPEDPPVPEPRALDADLVSLPAPPVRLEEPEPSVTPVPAVASLRVGADEPRTGPMRPVAEPLESAPVLPPGTAVELAATQTRAPAPPETPLPALARAVPTSPVVPAVLPVPAQAPEPTGHDLPVELRPRMTEDSLASRVPSSATTDAPPRVETTVAADTPSRWVATPIGLQRTSQDLPDVREFPESPPLARSVPPPVAGSRTELPESVPRADVAQEGGGSAGEPRRPAPSRRHLASPGDARATAAADGPEVVVEMGPTTAPSDATSPVTSAASAPLASAPRPGALVTAARTVPAPLPPGKRLPETGEASRGRSGSRDVADLLRPPGASLRKATFRGETAAPAPTAARLEPASGAPSAGAAGLDLGEAGRGPAPRDRSPTIAAPTLAAATGPERLLPEAPPSLRDETDLRAIRSPESRAVLARDLGGNDATEAAVARGLSWLARHQSRDGRWDVDRFDAVCGGCKSPGFLVDCDVAVTGLALLCFLGQNHTPQNAESPYRRHVRDAIAWLLAGQRADGCLARDDDRTTMYGHAIATFALGEAYVLTQDERLREPLRKAAELVAACQNPTTGGWRYAAEPPLRGDTSVSGWQVLALKSVEGGGIEVPSAVFDRARHWLDVEVGGGTHGGIYGYTTPDEPRVAMVAEGLYARLLLGGRKGDRNVEEAARYIHAETRGGRQLDNLYLLYYGNLALFHLQGWIWEEWNVSVRDFLVRTQERGGTLEGSWAPNGPWLESGGRVLSTAFAVLALEVYYRYLPLTWQAVGVQPPR